MSLNLLDTCDTADTCLYREGEKDVAASYIADARCSPALYHVWGDWTAQGSTHLMKATRTVLLAFVSPLIACNN